MNDSTYLPVRAIANALGLTAEWEDATSTVILRSGARRAAEGTPQRSSRRENVTITYRDIKINVDGELITPRDSEGKVVEPFIMNDSTYLPLRAVANALGLEVGWDDAASAAHLNTPGGVKPDPNAVWRLAKSSSIGYGGWTGTETVYEYDSAGVLRSGTTRYVGLQMNGQVYSTSTYVVDGQNRILREDDSLGNYSEYRYNSSGAMTYQKIYSVDADVSQTTSWEYDAKGRCVKETLTFDSGDRIVTTMTYGQNDLWDTFERLVDYAYHPDAAELGFVDHVIYGNCEYKYEHAGETRPSMMIAHLSCEGEYLDVAVEISYEKYGSYNYIVRKVQDGEVVGESWPMAVYYNEYGQLVQRITATGTENFEYERID